MTPFAEFDKTEHSEHIPFDPTGTTLVSTETGPAIRELANTVGVSASPGFTWGRSGNSTSGTYLQNDTVPSNVTGRGIFLIGGSITNISIANENVNTFDIKVQEHDGTTYTDLTTVSIVAARSGNFPVAIPVTTGKELAILVNSGSGKNIVVALHLKGSTV